MFKKKKEDIFEVTFFTLGAIAWSIFAIMVAIAIIKDVNIVLGIAAIYVSVAGSICIIKENINDWKEVIEDIKNEG